jgi:hypothetical protein
MEGRLTGLATSCVGTAFYNMILKKERKKKRKKERQKERKKDIFDINMMKKG